EVRLAPDHVHGQAGDPELLAAGRAQLADLGDGRDLAQEPEVVEAALLEARRHAEGRLARPRDLALHLPGELLDPGRRPRRLLLLELDERAQALVEGEIELDEPAREKRARDQAAEQPDVLPEEPASRLPGWRRLRARGVASHGAEVSGATPRAPCSKGTGPA